MICQSFRSELSEEHQAPPHAAEATTRPQTYPRGRPRADLHPKKVNNLGPMAPVPSKTSITRGPPVVAVAVSLDPYYPSDSQLQVYDIYIIRRVLLAAHARGVNILIWTSRKSVDHGTNDRVMVHGDGTRADGRRSGFKAQITRSVGSETRRPAPSIFRKMKIQCGTPQAGYLARPTTEAPETQIYFINHRSGANSVLRLRTVVRGERASRSIVNRTTALWSIWMVVVADTRGFRF